MKRKHAPIVILAALVLVATGTFRAQDPPGDNPPTFQSIGMLDALAPDLLEADCRVCHDAGVNDRHHLLEGLAIPPGSLVPYPDSDGDGNPDTIYSCLNCHDASMTVVRDCLVCHDAGSPHHTTQDAFDRHCSACHGDLVDDYDDGHYIPTYAASLVTPYRGLDGDGYENWPYPTSDLASDGTGTVLQGDVTWTEQGPPFFAVNSIGPLGTLHTRSAPNDLSFKPVGFNNDFVIRSANLDGATFHVEFLPGAPPAAYWNPGTQVLTVEIDTAQEALTLVNLINAATGSADVVAELGFDGDNVVLDLLSSEHYEPLGGDPTNHRGFGAGSCSHCHDIDGTLDANGQPDGLIWDPRTLHHRIGLPALVNDGAGGTWSSCNICHDVATLSEQSGPSFDLHMRKCEECHGPDSLHNIQTDSPNPTNIGTLVVGGEDAGYGHVGRDAGPGDSDCWGCHGFLIGARAPLARPVIPTLESSDVAVVTAGRDTTVVLRGSAFTSESNGIAYPSTVRLTDLDGSSVILQPRLMSPDRMSVTIPGETAPGNYDLRAVKERFASNPVVISVKPRVVVTEAKADRGRLTILGRGFGGYAEGGGTVVTAEVATSHGKNRTTTTVEGRVVSWSDTEIVAVFDRRPRRITVHSVFGAATSDVRGRGRPYRRAGK